MCSLISSYYCNYLNNMLMSVKSIVIQLELMALVTNWYFIIIQSLHQTHDTH
jgi:hypothetical protein